MWKIKTFKTADAMRAWIARNDGRMQWHELFINNGYGVQFRPLRRVY